MPFAGAEVDEFVASTPEFVPPGRVERHWTAPRIAINLFLCLCIGVGTPMGLTYLRERKKQRLILENRCLECGYHLQGLTVRRCPECGSSF